MQNGLHQNAYMERPIWTPDERDMASGSSTPQADRSDRFTLVYRSGQTGPDSPDRVRSCIATQN